MPSERLLFGSRVPELGRAPGSSGVLFVTRQILGFMGVGGSWWPAVPSSRGCRWHFECKALEQASQPACSHLAQDPFAVGCPVHGGMSVDAVNTRSVSTCLLGRGAREAALGDTHCSLSPWVLAA